MNPNNRLRSNNGPGRSRRSAGGGSKKTILIIAGAVLAVGLAAVLFLILSGKGDDKGLDYSASIDEAISRSNESVASAIDMGTLRSITFNPPDMGDYSKQDRSTDTFSNYISKDGKCAIGFGTLDSQEVPGVSVQEIVSLQLGQLRSGNSAINGPEVGDALVVKDAADPSKNYRMPTLNFKLSKNETRVSTRYSVVILGNGDRAVVNRECADTEGNEVPDSRLDELDVKARELTIMVES